MGRSMKSLLLSLFCLTCAQLSAQVNLTIPTIHGSPGDHVLIPVLIDQADDLCAIRFDLELDGAVLSVADTDVVYAGSVFADHGTAASLDSNRLGILILSPSLSELKSGSGVLVQVLADISDTAASGAMAAISISNPSAANADGSVLSVSTDPGTILISSQADTPAEGQNQLVFPQVANGGGYRTTVLLVNPLETTAQVKLRFAESGNQPLVLTLDDGTSDSTFNFSVPPKGSKVLRSDGSGGLKVGYAVLEATSPLTGTILFEIKDWSGETLTEAGVMSSPRVLHFEIPVLYQPGLYDTGLAFLNLNAESVQLDMVAKRADGSIFQSRTETLSAYEHLPLFSTQLFSQLSQLNEFEGSIEVTASLPVTAVALKMTGQVLTTFPISVSN